MSVITLCRMIKSAPTTGPHMHASVTHADRIEQYARRHPHFINTTSHEHGGFTPLIFAVVYERLEAATVLLDCGADVNMACAHGIIQLPPLYFALGQTRDEFTRFLLARGADLALVPPHVIPINLALAHSYWLDKARHRPMLPAATVEHMRAMHLSRLSEVFMSVVGQDLAITSIEHAITSFRAREITKVDNTQHTTAQRPHSRTVA